MLVRFSNRLTPKTKMKSPLKDQNLYIMTLEYSMLLVDYVDYASMMKRESKNTGVQGED